MHFTEGIGSMKKWLFHRIVATGALLQRVDRRRHGLLHFPLLRKARFARFFSAVRIFLMVFAGNFLFSQSALADQCVFSQVPSVINFGSILSGSQGTLSQPVQWQCSSGLLLTSYTAACYTVEPSVNGLSGTTRVMQGTSGAAASYSLLFDLYNNSDSTLLGARTTANFGNAPQQIQLTGILGVVPMWAIYNQTINGVVAANQVVPAGQYSTTSSIYIYYRSALLPAGLTCMGGAIITSPVTIQATIQPNCNVSATTISFGTQNTLTQTLSAQGSITLNCTLAQPYQITLGTNGYPPNQRRMISGNKYIQYGLYSDPAYQNSWGTTVPVTGTGTGLNQTIPVYALVPVQATPTSGTYTDTVAVTVTY